MYNGLDDRFFEKIDKLGLLQQNPEINKLIENTAKLFISVANLVPYKDYFTVLKAFEQLKHLGYNFSYLIVGEGPDKNLSKKI